MTALHQNDDVNDSGLVGGIGIVAACTARDAATIMLTGREALFDFMGDDAQHIGLHDLDAATVRAFAVSIERARCEGRSTQLTFGRQSVEIGPSDTTIVFRQGKRRLEVSHGVASEVERRCHSASNSMN